MSMSLSRPAVSASLLAAVLAPTACTLGRTPEAGHRIRIAFGGADAGAFARIPAEGDPTWTGERGAGLPSFITLPVVPRGSAGG